MEKFSFLMRWINLIQIVACSVIGLFFVICLLFGTDETFLKTERKTTNAQYVPWDIYDLKQANEFDYQCVQMKSEPETPICIYPDVEDKFISRSILQTGMWEPKGVECMQNVLRNNSDLGLIDIGTNIGVFSLLAAAMGRNVLSVEPRLESARRFHKSVKLGHLEDRVTLITNALNNKRGTCGLVLNRVNQGNIKIVEADRDEETNATDKEMHAQCITMNDLVPLCKFKRAIMKIDIEGREPRALAAADRLFDAIDIPYIMMEWHLINRILLESTSDEEQAFAIEMVRFLDERDYVPESIGRVPLNIFKMNGWPGNVIWKKNTII